jgi:undecaprenyl diphosphate synthase
MGTGKGDTPEVGGATWRAQPRVAHRYARAPARRLASARGPARARVQDSARTWHSNGASLGAARANAPNTAPGVLCDPIGVLAHDREGAVRDPGGTFRGCIAVVSREASMEDLSALAGKLPRHVGIIMDGNGRWARSRGLPREEGHAKGADSVRTVVRAARKIGVPALTLFAFSSQNWDRPPEEVFHLMELLRRYLVQEREEILDNGIRLVSVGDTDRLPSYVRAPLVELMQASAHNSDMILCLALSYGGRETIAKAARAMCKAAVEGRLDPDTVDASVFETFLESSQIVPPLDLLVRTSGEHRISNFFLWETAYAELHFTPKLWPEFDREDLVEALLDYAGRERRFGMTSDQVAAEPTAVAARGEAR